MRALGAGVVLALLAGCSSEQTETPVAAAEGSERIACAVDSATGISEACVVDRMRSGNQLSLIVHHPGGAFRRFAVVTDGRGLVVADGAEQARTAIDGDKLAVTVGKDRYLFPATMKSPPADARP